MSEVLTMVSGQIPPERADDVKAGFAAAVLAGMPERRHTSLYQTDEGQMRIVTVWRSRNDLQRSLSSTDRPFAVTLLEDAGRTPVVDVLELVRDSNTTWWP